uniref:Ig-like domain-containing protein n=1 Tax=Pundamilia nyererei TaxID=303518 RepID=A0A3B4GS04_9CICH
SWRLNDGTLFLSSVSHHASGVEVIHMRVQSGDDILNDQNHRYTNRTSMKADALQTGDLSLTLRNPTVSDGGTYTCIVRKYGQDQSKTHVQLKVKGQCVKSVSTQYDAFKILSV